MPLFRLKTVNHNLLFLMLILFYFFAEKGDTSALLSCSIGYCGLNLKYAPWVHMVEHLVSS